MKLEETESFTLQYVNRIQTNTTHINNIHDSDIDLSEKITEVLNIYEKNPNFKGRHLSRNGVIFAEDKDTALPSVDKNSKTTKKNHKNTKNEINHFINT